MESGEFTLDLFLKWMPDLYLILDQKLNIVAASDAYLAATMVKREAVLQQNVFDIFPSNPQDPTETDKQNVKNSFESVLREKKSDTMAVQKYDIRRPIEQGGEFEERYWSPINSPVLDANNNVTHILHRVEDVTEFIRLKQSEQEKIGQASEMEREIYQRAQEIQAINKELLKANTNLKESNMALEQFAYIASHDLQEPLRMIASYTQLLSERYEDKLDADAKKFIHYVTDGAVRMQDMLNSLLSYSRVTTQAKVLQPVDSEKMVEQALSNLTVAIQESQASIVCESLPTVLADPVQFIQLLQNLIANAIKFHPKDNPPQIYLKAILKDDKWVFSVQDNGIGIAPEFMDKLFMMCKRFHSRAEYPGSGIGLALCKKIVERHGGAIWAESVLDQGTTFYFTLPCRQAKEVD